MTADASVDALINLPTRDRFKTVAVDAAVHFIDRSGTADQIAKWREHDSDERHAGGRPAYINDRAVLAIMLLLAAGNSPLHLTSAAQVIEERESTEGLALLGIDASKTDAAWYSAFWRAWRRPHDTLDAFPAPRHRYLSEEEQQAVKAARAPVPGTSSESGR